MSRNTNIIDEFRTNDGIVGGFFDGKPLLLLHHVGAKTGTERVTPLMYQPVNGDSFAIFASKGGADDNPDWFYNVQASPDVKAEIGTEKLAVTARLASGDEHDRIWEQQKRDFPFFAEYEEKTARDLIPVVVLERS